MSKRISGVKNLVSNTGVVSRGVPFIQPRSPTANGVCVSTAGAGAGACSASGTLPAAGGAEGAAGGGVTGVTGAAATSDAGGGAPREPLIMKS